MSYSSSPLPSRPREFSSIDPKFYHGCELCSSPLISACSAAVSSYIGKLDEKVNQMSLGAFSVFQSLTCTPADATVLVYRKQENERVSPQRQEPITVYAHDRKFLLTLYKIPIRGLLIVAITHFYLKSTKPLILQSILPLKSLWEANLCQVYLRGQEATGQLHRPWKQRASPRQVMTKYVGYAFWLWRGKATAGDSASKQPGGQSIQDTEKEHSRKASK